MRYLPALDGLRALAVLAVIGVHIGYLDGGYQGVDVFFVLSGYLITSILLAEHRHQGRVRLGAFYIRRFLRLYPALIALLVAVPFLTFAAAYERRSITAESMLYSVTYTTNFAHAGGRGFSFFLDHTWSLAVEEQYYVIWPWVLLLLVRAKPAAAARVLVAAAVVLLGLRAGITAHWSEVDARTLPPTDSVELILGAALAFAPAAARAARATAAPVLALAGFVAVAVALPEQDPDGNGYWGITVTATASLLLVAYVVADGQLVRVLDSKPFVWLGRRSYGLYLYHFPIAAVFHLRIDSKPLSALATVVVSVAAAALSYRFVELPFLRLKHRRFEPPSHRPEPVPT